MTPHGGKAKERMPFDPSTPVILLSGRESTVAAARNFGRRGVKVIVSGGHDCPALSSRYCQQALPVPVGTGAPAYWHDILLANPMADLAGAVILPFCDESLAFIVANHAELKKRYLVEDLDAELRAAALDKQETLRMSQEVGVPTPQVWPVETIEDVEKLRDTLRLPVMVKPRDSYAFARDFGQKLFIVESQFDEVIEKVALSRSRGHEVMVVEMIPGPDDLLSSYYTYRTPDGRLLYEYTKSVIRRWPVNRGGACYHQSQWLPETAELGRRLFEGIDWQGIANVEFKRDLKDGKLKIIEINARITAAHRLVTESGAPIDEVIYCHLTGQPVPQITGYSDNVRMWYPIRDFLGYRELSKLGRLSFAGWIRSLMGQRLVFPYLSLDDPGPMFAELRHIAGVAFTGLKSSLRHAGPSRRPAYPVRRAARQER